MRRYIPLFFISFFMIVVTMAVLTYLSGYADRQNPENGKIITVYTTLPIEQVSLLSQEFEKQYQIRVSITPLQERELITRLILEQDTPHADLVLANRAVLEELKQKKCYLSVPRNKSTSFLTALAMLTATGLVFGMTQ
jgi:iron(III) transport system substrate-binding protein